MNWEVRVYALSDTTNPKAVYSPESPGIVNSITFDLEPSGNCLSGSFEAIPFYVDVEPRDLVKIYLDGTAKYSGYVTNGPNRYSKQVHTYNLEGLKAIIYNIVVDQWYHDQDNGLTSTGLIPHSSIIPQLTRFFPYWFSNTYDINASTTSGNRGPVLAADQNLGELIDIFTNSASDGETYTWGVNGDAQFFVNPIPIEDEIDFTVVDSKSVEMTEENADDVCTAVRFVFSVPEGYYHPELKREGYARFGSADTAENYEYGPELEPLSYEYEDTTLSATYGKLTKIVPLVLTDSWLRLLPWTSISDTYSHISIDSFSTSILSWWNNFRTNTGGTTLTSKLAAVSTLGSTSYIQNNVSVTDARTLILALRTEPLDEDAQKALTAEVKNVIGVHVRASLTGTTRPLSFESSTMHARLLTDVSPYKPHTVSESYRTEAEQIYNWGDVTIRTILPRLGLLSTRANPNSYRNYGYKNKDLRAITSTLYPLTRVPDESYTSIPINGWKVYEWMLIAYNQDALNGYGKTFITVPGAYPANIVVQDDLGMAPKALIDTDDGDISVNISRLSYTLSSQSGFSVTYTTGRDENRSNVFLTRLMARDVAAQNNAFLASQGRV